MDVDSEGTSNSQRNSKTQEEESKLTANENEAS